MFDEAGHRCESFTSMTPSQLSLARPAAGGHASLLPPVVLSQDSSLRQSDEPHRTIRPHIQRSTSGCFRSCLGASNDMREMDRPGSPPRVRAVTSMKSLLPLYLANPKATLQIRPGYQLRRTHSDPITPGQLSRDPPNHSALQESMSTTHSSLSGSSEALIGTQSTQALFDIGIFQPPKSGSSDVDAADVSRRCSLSASTPDQALAPNVFGALSLARPTRSASRIRSAGLRCSSEGSSSGQRAIKGFRSHAEEGYTAVPMRFSCFGRFRASRVVESEAEWLKGDLEETSWLQDASEEELVGDHVSSNASTEDSRWELESVASTRAESSIGAADGSVIEFATVLSPSRATLVDVSSKRSSTCSMDMRTSSPATTDITVPGESCPSSEVPVTPPSSPDRTFLDLDCRRKTAETPIKGSSSVTQLLRGQMGMTPPQTPEDSAARSCARHAGLGTILSMLEQVVAEFPSTIMKLDSPVVSCIRIYIKSAEAIGCERSPGFTPYTACLMSHHDQNSSHAQQRAKAGTGPTDISWFREILGTSKDALPRGIYAHIMSLNFLDDILRGEAVSHGCITTPTPSSRDSAHSDQCAYDDLVRKAQILRQGLQLCLSRLVESVVDVSKSNEVLLRSLMAVVRLAEGRAVSVEVDA